MKENDELRRGQLAAGSSLSQTSPIVCSSLWQKDICYQKNLVSLRTVSRYKHWIRVSMDLMFEAPILNLLRTFILMWSATLHILRWTPSRLVSQRTSPITAIIQTEGHYCKLLQHDRVSSFCQLRERRGTLLPCHRPFLFSIAWGKLTIRYVALMVQRSWSNTRTIFKPATKVWWVLKSSLLLGTRFFIFLVPCL